MDSPIYDRIFAAHTTDARAVCIKELMLFFKREFPEAAKALPRDMAKLRVKAGIASGFRYCSVLSALLLVESFSNRKQSFDGLCALVKTKAEYDPQKTERVLSAIESLPKETRPAVTPKHDNGRTACGFNNTNHRKITFEQDDRAFGLVTHFRATKAELEFTDPSITTLIKWFKLAGLKYSRYKHAIRYTPEELDRVMNFALASATPHKVKSSISNIEANWL